MDLEQTIKILIYIHAVFGGIALLSGLVSIITRKGLAVHKKAGLIFFYSLLLSSVIAMIVSFLPNHESPFLFAVAIFSLYFLLAGKRALNFKYKNTNLLLDKWISRIMIIVGILMIFIPIIFSGSFNVVLLVFAILGIVFAVRDLILFKKPEQLKRSWLKFHLGKMFGAYISTVTAFVVVNEFFPGVYGWFIPGIVGAFFIAYWVRKVNKKTAAKNA